jgi:hypothetical protein
MPVMAGRNGNGGGPDLWMVLLARLDRMETDMRRHIRAVSKVVAQIATRERRKFAALERRIEALEARS